MMKVRLIGLLCVAFVAMLVGASEVQGGFLFQGLITHGEYSPYSGDQIRGPGSPFGGPLSATQSFDAADTGAVTDFYLAVWNMVGDNSFTLTLKDSTGNVLETLTGTAPQGHKPQEEDFTPIPIVHIVSNLNPVLVAGNTYSVTLSTNGAGDTRSFWDWESPFALARPYEERGLDVVGVAAVPEPSSLVLLGLGGLGLAAVKRRRRVFRSA